MTVEHTPWKPAPREDRPDILDLDTIVRMLLEHPDSLGLDGDQLRQEVVLAVEAAQYKYAFSGLKEAKADVERLNVVLSQGFMNTAVNLLGEQIQTSRTQVLECEAYREAHPHLAPTIVSALALFIDQEEARIARIEAGLASLLEPYEA